MQGCDETMPGELLRAVEQFNRREWFECHETLEELWVGARGELRDFYQGFLQVAVALHHWREGNYKGAVLLLEKGPELLRRAPPICQGVDVAALIAAAERLRATLVKLGPGRMEEVDDALLPVVALPARG
ncbi:DUF309 domain-containing protein [Geomesophilobacter sediminis]|uniref:DUF309 domain-containing protein n=1 Tax=Geomesophilobacter sediminis TaxID=2798584 RepID=A0A8J7IL61_9BACT|nr:DUF309 domain-containing protein [Geomesophilobacter sediminis]MBJ6723423.1 DUF309 domain-containing protein [Geomesophilobacter sediminis]